MTTSFSRTPSAPRSMPDSMVEILQRRAQQQPSELAYTFLLDGDSQEASLTFAELDRQARLIAQQLRPFVGLGDRVLLLYPPGLAYITAFFGCLYAGAIAVPAYPPALKGSDRMLPRIVGIVRDAQPAVILATESLLGAVDALIARAPEFGDAQWLATDQTGSGDSAGAGWVQPDITSESLAFFQYTSGSTAAPKGVMVSHGNLLHNTHLMQTALEHTHESTFVSWLPLYHDMGLIGNMLHTLFLGSHCILLSPMAFLQRPIRWLRAVSRYQAHTSGGPNFAYDLCARKITPEQKAELDLSSWTVAYSGSEMVRRDTLERFAEAFASCGFRREALTPSYGLAEGTLFVVGARVREEYHSLDVADAALREHQARLAVGAEEARTVVSNGTPVLDQDICVVDPETRVECAPDQVGEIWAHSPSVAQGYWRRPDATAYTFAAQRADGDDRRFLRTGDLGFFHNGELYITGRLKDVIIIRGKNHYPVDIEVTVEEAHEALRPAGGAAFSVDVEGDERLVVVQEVERQYRHADMDDVRDAIRQAVAERHELQVYDIVLIMPGTLPKTSSGKTQRHAARERYLAKSLELVG